MEAALHAVDPEMKPHWGKTHHCGAATLERLYGAEKLEAFRALASEHDPQGKFRALQAHMMT